MEYNLKFAKNERSSNSNLKTSVKLFKNYIWIGKAATIGMDLKPGKINVRIGFDYTQRVVAIVPAPEGEFRISVSENRPDSANIFCTSIVNQIAATVGTRPDVSIENGWLILKKSV